MLLEEEREKDDSLVLDEEEIIEWQGMLIQLDLQSMVLPTTNRFEIVGGCARQ